VVTRRCDVVGVVRTGGLPRAGVSVACDDEPDKTTAGGHFALSCPCAVPSLRLDDGDNAREVPVSLVAGQSSWVELHDD
jgi:hypothetical protein